MHPYRLEFLRGRWYLNGFDRTRESDRWFRMDRVQGPIEVVGEPAAFERPETAVPGLQLDPWVLGGVEDPVTARIWFDPAVAHTIRAALGDEAVVLDEPEGLEVELRVTNRDGFRSWVLGFGDRAEVLGPEELRNDVVAWLRDLVAGAGS